MFLAEAQSPSTFEQLSFNEHVSVQLRHVLYNRDNNLRQNLPHVLIHGRPGSGKRVRALAYLRELAQDDTLRGVQETFRLQNVPSTQQQTSHVLQGRQQYGSNVQSLSSKTMVRNKKHARSSRHATKTKRRPQMSQHKVDDHTPTLAYNDNVITATLLTSSHHVEVVLDHRTHTHKDLIQAILTLVSSGHTLRLNESSPGPQGDNTLSEARRLPFKYIFLHGIDRLSCDAQLSLRRSMETQLSQCRMLMTAVQLSHVNPALRSRCVCIRNPAPTDNAIQRVLLEARKHRVIRQAPRIPNAHECQQMAKASRHNLIEALFLLERAAYGLHKNHYEKSSLMNNAKTLQPSWSKAVYTLWQNQLWRVRKQHQTPLAIQSLRKSLYEILSRGISVNAMFETFVDAFMQDVGTDTVLSVHLLNITYAYANASSKSQDPIFALEAWAQKVCQVLQTHFTQTS